MTFRARIALLSGLLLAGASSAATAREWTRFRGPNGTGISPATGVPTTWTAADFRWRVPIAGTGHSQPVIWDDRLFLTTANQSGTERTLLCLDKKDGRELWAKTFPATPTRPGNRNSGFANASPVVDGERVVALFVSREHFHVRAFAHDGRELWSRDLGPFESQHGHGASPMIYGDTVIVTNDQDGESSVVALSLKTGEPRWTAARRSARQGTAYGTPIVHTPPGGKPQLLLTSQAHGISGLDPDNGSLLWESPVYDKRMVASPVVAGEVAIGSCGSGAGGGNYLTAVRLGGKGDVSATHAVYTLRKATPYVPTPLYLDGRLYLISDGGIATAVEAATGREIWSERLRAEFFGSPVLIGGNIYVPSTKGEMIVFAPGDTFTLIARNPLGEGTHSTPCVDGGRIYMKTFTHLVCIGGQ